MENTAEHKTNAPIEERRRLIARWLTEHVKPTARVLAKLAEAKEVEPPPEIEIREYQLDAWANLWDARQAGKKRSLVHLATGLGKTFVAVCDVMKYRQEWAEAHGDGTSPRFLFISHKNEIQEQAAEDFLSIMPGLDIDMFETQREGVPEDVDMRFASFQAILSEKGKFDPEDYEYIIYDEAHHTEAETFREIRDYFDPLFELALTATPRRMDEQDITEYFGQPVYSKDLPEAMAEGLVADVEYHIMLDDAVREAIESGFDPKTLAELYELMRVMPRNEKIAEHIREEQRKQGEKAKTIVFCQDVDHAEAMATELDAVAYHSKMPKKIRRQILKDFRLGKIRTVCTRDMFNEGINIPDATILAFSRMTGSEAVFFQQLGRGLRGRNKRVTVLDFVANVERIARLRELSEAVRRHAEEIGEKTIKDPRDDIEDTGIWVRTNHTEFDFDRLVVSLLEKFTTLRSEAEVNILNNSSDQELIELALRLKPSGPLTVPEIGELSKKRLFISATLVSRRFGSIVAFQRSCGFEVREYSSDSSLTEKTNDELIALALELKPDGPLSFAEINAFSQKNLFVSDSTIRARFGRLSAFQAACGFEPRAKFGLDLTNEEIVALACDLKPDAPLTSPEIKDLASQKRFVSGATIRNRFGSLADFQKMCGFEARDCHQLSNDELIALALKLKPDGPLSSKEMDRLSKKGAFISSPTIRSRFGSITDFQKACGFESIVATSMSRAEMIALAIELKPQGPMTMEDCEILVTADGRSLSHYQIVKEFGSMIGFQRECGFEIRDYRQFSIEELVALALKLKPDGPLTTKEIASLSKEQKFPSQQTIRERFGSLQAFQRSCGFEVRDSGSSWSNETIVEKARLIKPDGPLSVAEINALSKANRFVSLHIIGDRFGSTAAFQEACGFTPIRKTPRKKR